MDSRNVRVSDFSLQTETPPSVVAPALAGGGETAPAESSPFGLNVAEAGAEVSLLGADDYVVPASRLAPIVAAPAVTDEQRQRLRRAIAAYRSEA